MPESVDIKPPRPLLPVFFVLDTSRSMYGERISALNRAMVELQWQLEQRSASEDIDVRVGALQFNTNCQWVTGEELVPADELVWECLESRGMTVLGDALEALDAMLSRWVKTLFRTSFSVYRPVIVFVTDGIPADNYEPPLEAILRSKWYQRAVKYAIAMSDDADADLLAQLVQGEENVLSADDEQFGQLLMRQTMECCANSIRLGDELVPDPDNTREAPGKAEEDDVWPDMREWDD